MIQNIIISLSRNPIALKALADLIAPLMRNLIKQETDPEIARLRQEVDALNLLVSRELPSVLANLNARQNETSAGVVELRQQLAELLRRQEERETALRLELERARHELAELQKTTGQSREAETGLRRWFPW